eukprot:TRINITY_DN562_c1_g1_i2.p1 TRINITY_DN562_c1_g1~~TRINITY_DN562_c1_g1_i2.p1  ORF type:complete len:215 (+),score=22.96 TRINITY_DN562_c1_g1_i2:2-646(+)
MDIAPVFKAQLETLTGNLKCQVCQLNSGCKPSLSKGADRFVVLVPCGSLQLRIMVLLDQQNPHHPPDFILDDTTLDYSSLSSVTWDVNDSMSLLRLIREILNKLQGTRDSILNYPNDVIQFECSIVRHIEGVQFSIVTSPNVEILISVPLEVTPSQLWLDLCGVDTEKPRLEVTYYPESISKTPSPTVSFSPSIAACFDSFSNKKRKQKRRKQK